MRLSHVQRRYAEMVERGWEIRLYPSGVSILISPNGEKQEPLPEKSFTALLRKQMIRPGGHVPGAAYQRYIHVSAHSDTVSSDGWIATAHGGWQLDFAAFTLHLTPFGDDSWEFSLDGLKSYTAIPGEDRAKRSALATMEHIFQEALKSLLTLRGQRDENSERG